MINPTIRDCALSLLLASSDHHNVRVGVSYAGSIPVEARVSSPHGAVIRQLTRDLRALKVPVKVVGGLADRQISLVAEFS